METRTQLEEAAVELVLRDGLEHATIDAISERAFVSTRTFFNYFDCKEDALLGIGITGPLDDETEVTEEIGPGDDLVTYTIHLLLRSVEHSIRNRRLRSSRKEIITKYPELLQRQLEQTFRVTSRLTTAVGGAMASRCTSPTTSENIPQCAEVILMMCGGAARAAIREWVLAGAEGQITDIELRAIELAREVKEAL